MECRPQLIPVLPAHSLLDPDKDALSALRPASQSASIVSPRRQACPAQHRLVSPAVAPVRAETRQSLPAQRLIMIIVPLAAGALRWRQFTVGPPRTEPSLHVVVP